MTIVDGSRYPVEFEATVTYTDPVWNFFFVAAADAAIFVHGGHAGQVSVGQLVRIQGELVEGDLSPVIEASAVTVLGESERESVPIKLNLSKHSVGQHDCQMVEVDVDVLQVTLSGERMRLIAKVEDLPVYISVAEWGIEFDDAIRFVGQRVRCIGALGVQLRTTAFAVPGDATAIDTFRLFCPRIESVRCLNEDDSRTPSKRITIGELTRRSSIGRFRTHGQISLIEDGTPDRHVVLFDERDAIRLAVSKASELYVGMVVRVGGQIARGADGKIIYQGDIIQKLGYSILKSPHASSVAEVDKTFQLHRRVNVEGQPISLEDRGDHAWLTLKDAGVTMEVMLKNSAADPNTMAVVRPSFANRVRVVGVCKLNDRLNSKAKYKLIASRAEDVEVVERDWSPVRIAWGSLSALLLAFLAAMLWVRKLRSRVQEKSADYVRLTAQLRSSIDAIDDGVLALDNNWKALAVNAEFLRLIKANQRVGDSVNWVELIGKRVQSRDKFISFKEQFERAPDRAHTATLDFAGVDQRRVVIRTAPIKVVNQSEPIGRLVVVRDETEKFRLQAELSHSNKLEAVGRMVGGIAHDFNNVLMAVAANLTIAQFDEGATVGSVKNELSVAEEAAFRGSDIVCRLLNFSGKDQLHLEPHRINGIVERLGELVRHTFDATIRFEFQLDPSDPVVLVDSTAVEQVLLNLYVNAKDAMPDGGLIETTTEVVRNTATQEEVLMITVADSGRGVPPEVRDRIFDPYFTTKSSDKGTGLGLSVSYRVLQQHGGMLQYKNGIQGGSVFQMVLPRDEVSDMIAPPEDRALPRGDECILVVDDEDVVRAVATTMLRKQGFRAIPVGDGNEALEMLTRDPDAYDCVLLDLTMPGLPGRAVLEAIKRNWPKKPVILCSGYLGGSIRGISALADAELPKPYSMRKLVTIIDSVLRRYRDEVVVDTKRAESDSEDSQSCV